MKNTEEKTEKQKMKEASEKLDAIRKRSKPVSAEEIAAWIKEGRE